MVHKGGHADIAARRFWAQCYEEVAVDWDWSHLRWGESLGLCLVVQWREV
jgi:hypothetical protein